MFDLVMILFLEDLSREPVHVQAASERRLLAVQKETLRLPRAWVKHLREAETEPFDNSDRGSYRRMHAKSIVGLFRTEVILLQDRRRNIKSSNW